MYTSRNKRMCSADATLDEQASSMFQRRYRLHTARINTILMDGWSVLVDPFSASYVAKLKAMSAVQSQDKHGTVESQQNDSNTTQDNVSTEVGRKEVGGGLESVSALDNKNLLPVPGGWDQGSKEKEPV